MLADTSVVTRFIKGGRLRALAITGATRTPDYSDVPTLDETGLREFNVIVWVGLAAPAGMSRTSRQAWNDELRRRELGAAPEDFLADRQQPAQPRDPFADWSE